MTVSAILAGKGRDVATAAPDVTIEAIAQDLNTRRIGAVVIIDGDGEVCGILSERDVVTAVARHGKEALGRPVADVMTRTVATCLEGETVAQIMGRMTEGRFRHMPVVEGGKLVGIVSIGDIVKARIAEAEREAEQMRAFITTA